MDTHQGQFPKALPYLSLTEMWERFGLYVVQGLLVLYMTNFFGYSDSESYLILGIFTGLIYITPLAGGYIANRYLGFKTTITWGGFFLIAGYGLLALPYAQQLFYPALATIIVGNGLFKPNISSLLGLQYAADDPKRDAGFTIFYIGINLGVLLSGLIAGYTKNAFGWHVCFALASLGLVIGLFVFWSGRHHIKSTHLDNTFSIKKNTFFFFGCLASIVLCHFLFRVHALADWLLPTLGIAVLIGLSALTFKQQGTARQNIIVLNLLIASSVLFWMLFFQLFYAANLFIDRLVDKTLFGIPLTTTIFYASESVFIILLGPIFAWGWQTLSQRQLNINPLGKFAAAMFFVGLGFLVMSISTTHVNEAGLVNCLWIFFAYLLITIGELLLSPIGLSAVTTLAPPHLLGLMMGIWFVATGFGGIFAGWLAQLANVPESAQTISEKLAIYHQAFLYYALCGFTMAILLYVVHHWVKKRL